MWFEHLTGFAEAPAEVRQLITLQGDKLLCQPNGAALKVGTLLMPTLAELKQQAQAVLYASDNHHAGMKLAEIVADVQDLHLDSANAGALFQVASQFNLLEMMSPEVTPEQGISRYEYDKTQGPACAIACGAGLIYRNYVVPLQGHTGQSADCQLDMLDQFGPALSQLIKQPQTSAQHEAQSSPWRMVNGYALPSGQQLSAINQQLQMLDCDQRTALKGLIKMGIQQDTQVTLNGALHCVTQAYCSAMPVAYSQHSTEQWQGLATLILEAAYEASLAAAVINAKHTGNNKVYLTLLGGGAFGNPIIWIISAIRQAILAYQHADLDVYIVSYGQSNADVRELVRRTGA